MVILARSHFLFTLGIGGYIDIGEVSGNVACVIGKALEPEFSDCEGFHHPMTRSRSTCDLENPPKGARSGSGR